MDNIAIDMENINNLTIPPYAVRTVGWVRGDALHSTPGTKQGDVMLLVFTSGVGWYQLRGQHRRLDKPMVGLIFPEQSGVLLADQNDPYTHAFLRFNGEWAKNCARKIQEKHQELFFQHPAHAAIVAELENYGATLRTHLPEQIGQLELSLARILMWLMGESSVEQQNKILKEHLLDYFVQHMSNPIQLDAMAAHFKIHKGSLCRRGKQLLGLSVAKAWESSKLSWAKQLLSTTGLSVAEVARRVGYEDAFYFSRVFKNYSGHSPKAWQLQFRKIKD